MNDEELILLRFWEGVRMLVALMLGVALGMLAYRNHVLNEYEQYSKEHYVPFQETYPPYLQSKAIEADGQFYVDIYEGTNAVLDEPAPVVTEVDVIEVNPEITDEILLLAKCIEAEAGNQELLGKRLVADVILNRVTSSEFPNDIETVIKQPGQFSTWSNGMIARAEPTIETMDAVYAECGSRINQDILYFTANGYGQYGTPWQQVGDHYFCTK